MNNQEYNAHLEQVVAEALATLPERERYVLEQRCGYRGEPRSQHDLASELGVSRARVGQIEMSALRRLRAPYQRIRYFYDILPAVISRGEDDFYTRFFIKLFGLKSEHIARLLMDNTNPGQKYN